jgi:hypothetical protein
MVTAVTVVLTEVLVGVAGVGVSAVIVEVGSTTVVGFGCTCGGGVAFGGCVAAGVGVGAEVGFGVGVGAGFGVGVGVGGHNRIHAELIAWVTATFVRLLNEHSKSG